VLDELGLDRSPSAAEAGFLLARYFGTSELVPFPSLFEIEFSATSELVPFPSPCLLAVANLATTVLGKGTTFSRAARAASRHAASAAEGQRSNLNPGYAEQ
jgi:hypothetical protein